MSAIRRRIVALVLAAGLGRSGSALADGSTNGEDLFLQGRSALNEGKFDLARSYFEQSQAIQPAVGPLLNLAACAEKLHLLRRAIDHLNEAMTKVAPTDKRAPLIRVRIAELEQRTPHLTG